MATRKIKGSWWVDVTFRHRRYRLRSPDNHRDGAVEYERCILSKLTRGESVHHSRDARGQHDGTEPFEAFAARWLSTYVETNLAESTQAEYAGVLRRVLVPFFRQLPLEAIDAYAVERLKALRRSGGASAKTVNNDLFVLSKLLRTAHEWGSLRATPKVRFLKEDPPKTDFLTTAESRSVLEHTPNPMWRVFIFVALRTGLRAGELIGLRWEDVDFGARLIVVRRNIVDGVVKAPKSRRIRYVAMAWDLQAVLNAVRKPNGYVFALPGDEPITRAMAASALRRACMRAGLRSVGLHVLRHSFASHLVMEGQDLYAVGRLLGHADPSTTQRYAHLAPAYLRSVVDSLPSARTDELVRLVGLPLGNPQSTDGERPANMPNDVRSSNLGLSADFNEKRPA